MEPNWFTEGNVLNLTLKNIPVQLHARLKASAAANRRSLNREILALLESQLEAPVSDVAAELRALEDFVASLPSVDHARVVRYRSAGRA
jgi:plasmid stability protein